MRWPAVIFILLAGSGVVCAETFVSRTHGVSFEIPAGMSVAGGSFDGRIARLDKKDAGSISVRRVNGHLEKIEKIAKDRFARLPSDISLGSFFDSTIGGRKVSSAAFEFPSQKIRGAVFYVPSVDGGIEILCAGEESKHLEIFFDCAGLIEHLKFFKAQDKNPHKEAEDCAPFVGPEEDPDAIELEIFENGLDLSGACSAVAWHRAALGVSHLNLDEAKRWLLFAIESDRSYIPAYILFARLKLAGGEDAGGVVNDVNRLLNRAPQSEEILKLKEKLAGIAYK